MKKLFWTAALTGAATLWWAERETHKFELHEVTVPILPRGHAPIRVLHVSDLHMIRDQHDKQRWVASLDRLDPDLVINTGDNLGGADGVQGVAQALNPLLRRPGAFVFGSNDYFAPRPVNPFIYLVGRKRRVSTEELPWRELRSVFTEHGWIDATHTRAAVQFPTDAGMVRVLIAGVDDPHHDLDDYDSIADGPLKLAGQVVAAIGLSHAPEPRVLDRFAGDGFHIVFSGHTHGGQLCLPGGRAIVTNCGIDRGRAAGLSRWTERMWLHVSNGLGSSRYVPFRTFCRPSATLVQLVAR